MAESKWRQIVELDFPEGHLAFLCRDFSSYEGEDTWPTEPMYCDGTVWVGHDDQRPCPVHSLKPEDTVLCNCGTNNKRGPTVSSIVYCRKCGALL